MGIQTWIKRWKRKRSQTAAITKGEQLTSSGQVRVSTTSGYISVPKTSPLVSGGGGGGGSGGSGGGTSAGAGITPTISVKKITPAEAVTKWESGKTIQSQIQPSPSAIGLPVGDRQFATLSIWEGVKGSGTRLFQKVVGSPTSERPSFSDIIAPMDRTVSPKVAGEALVIDGQVFDTEHLTGFQKKAAVSAGATLTTFGELQKDIEVGRIAQTSAEFKKLQSQLDVGKTTLEKAEAQYKTFQEDVFQKSPDIKGIREPGRATGTRTMIDLSLFSNPLTAFSAAAVSLKQDPLIIDTEAEKKGASIEAATTQRPGITTTMFLGGGVLGAGSALFRGGRALETENIKEALRQAELARTGHRFVTGKGFTDISKGLGVTDSAVALKSGVVESKLVDKTLISTGRESYAIFGQKYFSDKYFVMGGVRDVASKIPISSFVKGQKLSVGVGKAGVKERMSFGAVLTKKGLIGEARTFPGAKFDFQPVAGLSQKEGDIIKSIGGRISEAELKTMKGKGFEAFGKVDIHFPIETATTLKIVKPKKDIVSKIFKDGKVVSKPPTQFLQEVISSPPTSLTFEPTTIITKTEPLGFGLPKMVGGLGLREVSIAKTSGIMQQDFSRSGLLSTKGDFKTLGLVSQSDVGLSTPSVTLLETPRVTGRVGSSFAKAFQAQPVAQIPRVATTPKLIPKEKLASKLIPREKLTLDLFAPQPTTFRTPKGFDFIRGFGMPLIFPPIKLLGGEGLRGKRVRKKKLKVPIRPSLTGIVLDIQTGIPETIKIGGVDIGLVPGQIRGVPKRKVKKKKTKKKKIKKKENVFDLGLTDF